MRIEVRQAMNHFFNFDHRSWDAKAFIVYKQNKNNATTIFFYLEFLIVQNYKSFMSALLFQLFFSQHSVFDSSATFLQLNSRIVWTILITAVKISHKFTRENSQFHPNLHVRLHNFTPKKYLCHSC